MYRLLLTDLDDTLLDSNGKISDENKNAIKKATEKGCNVVICSGRSNMSLEKFNKQLDRGINIYTIGYNGGIIYRQNEVLACHYLDKDLVLEIINFCKNYDIGILLYQDSKAWIDNKTELITQYCIRSALTPQIVDNLSQHISDKVNKIIILSDFDKLKQVEKDLPQSILQKCCTFFSSSILFEFNPLDIDKGSALIELAACLGIPISETIAIGDNENDIPMVCAAGLGIAVKNAINDLKEKADYITENDNNNNAVAEIINKFVL